jgi:hypothetical protein
MHFISNYVIFFYNFFHFHISKCLANVNDDKIKLCFLGWGVCLRRIKTKIFKCDLTKLPKLDNFYTYDLKITYLATFD